VTGELHGRVALVTGAAQGIGAAVAHALAGAGAVIAAVDRQPEPLAAVVAALAAGDRRAAAFTADVSDAAAVERTVAAVERDLGPIDILVNVAGILRMGPAAQLDDGDWAHSLAVNAGGVFHLCRAVAPRMAGRGRGAIVTVGSNAGRTPRQGMAAYAASKAAAAMYTRCLGLELAGRGVRCNVVSPGSTDTPMQRAMWTPARGAQAVIDGDLAAFRLGIPLGRIADAADVAEAVLFLASDRARHITMHDLCIDGGATLGA
jgi:2,3-dihydro-2,3-dihydroxybenzoate dehydrogenase